MQANDNFPSNEIQHKNIQKKAKRAIIHCAFSYSVFGHGRDQKTPVDSRGWAQQSLQERKLYFLEV